MSEYNVEYHNVLCYAVNWNVRPYQFYFVYNNEKYIFTQKRYISQTSDIDHIKYAIMQFLEC